MISSPAVRDCCRANEDQLNKLQLDIDDLNGEHDDIVDLINAKLKDLG